MSLNGACQPSCLQLESKPGHVERDDEREAACTV